MWWLGSLPCAYCPIRPEMSGEASSPVTAESAANSASSLAMNASSPPISPISPRTSCGANHECCQAFPSV